LKAPSGTAWAEVVPTELLQQFLVPMHDAESPLDMGLRGVSPSSAYLPSRKEGRLSSSSWRHMTGLLFLVPDHSSPGRIVSQIRTSPSSMRESTTLPNKRMQLTKLRAAPVWQAEVPPCAPAGEMGGGTASQLIRGVRRTTARAGRGTRKREA